MPTSIDMFKKVYIELDISSSPQQYNLTNDTFYTNSCFLNFSLITNSQTQVVNLSVIQKTSVNGTIENTQTFTLNNNNNFLKRNINLFTPYTLIDISYNSLNSILSGFIEKMTLGDTIVVDASGQTIAVRGGVDISGQRVVTDISGQRVVTDISGQRVVTDISGQSMYIVSVDVSSNTVTQVKSTTNYQNINGLNVYPIFQKSKTINMSGAGLTLTAQTMYCGGSGNISPSDFTWARDTSKNLWVSSAGALKTINYTYISNIDGKEYDASYTPAALGTVYPLTTNNMACINKVWLSSNITATNNIYNIYLDSGGAKSLIRLDGFWMHNQSIFMCPANARAYVSFFVTSVGTNGDFIKCVHWSSAGYRTIRSTMYVPPVSNNPVTLPLTLTSNCDGGIFGWIEAGETIAFFNENALSASKYFSATVNIIYF